jgi:WD40 repeat protein
MSVSGNAQANVAGRDIHVHYEDGGRTARRATASTTVECPYPGLAAFTTEQSRWFFGRDALTMHLVERAAERLDEGGPLMVVAPSGAGKSSLLRAGLLAAITQRGALPVLGSAEWPQLVFTPTDQPVTALVRGLAEVFDAETDEVSSWVTDPDALVAALRLQLDGQRIIIVVDQLEELFALCANAAERGAFLDLLDAVTRAGSCGLVVYGLRIDAYTHCVSHPSLRSASQEGQVVVGPMTETELRQAVLFPAREVGLDVEPGLVELLLRDLGQTGDAGYEAGRLPLLAHALRAAWRERHGDLLTVDGYLAAGGIHNAVATTAERVYARLDRAGRDAARTLFLRLVKIGDGSDDTRRVLQREELLCDNSVLDVFTDSRLLTQEQDTVTITHEVLLKAWPRLRGWLDEDRAGHLVRQRLEDDASGWDSAHRDPTLLYRGIRLEAIQGVTSGMTAVAQIFHAASVKQATRTRRRRRQLIALLCTLTLTAGTAAGIAVRQRDETRAAVEQLVASDLISKAQRLRSTSDDQEGRALAAQLDVVAWKLRQKDPTADNLAAYTGLVIDAATALPLADDLVTDAIHSAIAVLLGPDSETLAVSINGSRSGVVQLWEVDAPAPRALSAPLRHERPVTSMAFSPNGGVLAVASTDAKIHLWNVSRPASPVPLGVVQDDRGMCIYRQHLLDTPPPVLCEHFDEVAAFTDDNILAVGRVGSHDGDERPPSAGLWDVSNPAAPKRRTILRTADGKPLGILAADSRRRLVVAGRPERTTMEVDMIEPSVVQLWTASDPRKPRPLAPLPLSLDPFLQSSDKIKFSSLDSLAVMTNVENHDTIDLLDLPQPGKPVQRGSIPTTTGVINSYGALDYSADGHTLAVAHNNDYSIRLWDVRHPELPRSIGQPLTGHRTNIISIDYSADGDLLISADTTGVSPAGLPGVSSARIWNLDAEENVRWICATTTSITPEQWREHVPELEYDPPCH